jgi:perosamine synthetase
MTSSPNDLADEIRAALGSARDPLRQATQVTAFEKEVATYFGVREAIAVSSGTAALHTAFAALELRPGDEVLVPAVAVIMAVAPILYQGATPIFVDTDLGRVDFDYDDLERKVSPRTRAVLPVYMWGCAYNLDRLSAFAERFGIALVEDACQAHGGKWRERYLGTWGHLGCFSMKDGKLLATGEGGFLLTNIPELADACRAVRNHWVVPNHPAESHSRLGYNYRLTELQGLLARRALAELDTALDQRRAQTEYVLQGLTEIDGLEPYEYDARECPNYFSAVILRRDSITDSRNIADELAQRGIVNSVGTFGLRPVQEWPAIGVALSSRGPSGARPDVVCREISETPNARSFLKRVLALSIFSHYQASDLDGIIEGVKSVLMSVSGGRLA